MPDNRNTDYEGAAQLTVSLVDHAQTPDRINPSHPARRQLLIRQTFRLAFPALHHLSVASLAALYRQHQTGAGYRRSRLYGEYEAGRKERERDTTGQGIDVTGVPDNATGVSVRGVGAPVHTSGVLVHTSGVLVRTSGVLVHTSGVLVHTSGALVHTPVTTPRAKDSHRLSV